LQRSDAFLAGVLLVRLPREAFDVPFGLWQDGRADLDRFVAAQIGRGR
jgi:hypothetical protein